VSAARCEYLVPGLLAEKVAQLLKTLPQKIRRNCVPVPDFAAKFCEEIKRLIAVAARAVALYPCKEAARCALDAFRLEQLPLHLLMNFVVWTSTVGSWVCRATSRSCVQNLRQSRGRLW